MAIQRNNVVMQGVSGKVGKTLVFRQMGDGKAVIATRPKTRKAPVTPAEEASRQRFKQAAHIAKQRAQDPILRPQYLAKAKPGQSAYLVALKEYLNEPCDAQNCQTPELKSPQHTHQVPIEMANLTFLTFPSPQQKNTTCFPSSPESTTKQPFHPNRSHFNLNLSTLVAGVTRREALTSPTAYSSALCSSHLANHADFP